MLPRSIAWIVALVAFVVMADGSGSACAQEQPATPAGPVILQTEGGPVQVMPVPGGPKPDQPPVETKEKPEGPEGEEGKAKKPEGAEKKPEEKPKTVQRPEKPAEPPDPRELDVRPDPDGKVRFRFRGQAWPDVLDWLAMVSGMSLDWQELPADYLNLMTHRSYTLPEARDLINRHLMARGFTMLIKEDVLSVVKLEKIDPALVPRVSPEELADLLPHQYVKTSFALDWLIAETAVDELKPMLSPHGKLTALSTTNRLEAMDAAANLRELYAVLQAEQSSVSQDRLVKEFVLKYTRADDVRTQLMALLGIQERTRGPAMPMMDPQQMQMMQQQAEMMAQMQRQGGPGMEPGGPGAPRGRTRRTEEEVFLVVDPRRNSILANAPPDKMAIIAKAVETIDVPTDRDQTLLLNINRMQVYRLAALDPESLTKTLQDVGDLDPTTHLEVDKKNRAIIAYASLADHMTIRTVIDKLDGSGRRFEVIRLRRLAADYVAGTIEFMMGQQEQPQEQRPRFFGFFGFRREPEEEQERDQFRVDADVENNRLLLWTNDIELEEVRNLLVKLGEIPADGELDRVRVIDLDPEEAAELLERVRKTWPSFSPNPLLIPEEQDRPETVPQSSPGKEAAEKPLPDMRTDRPDPAAFEVRFAQLQEPSDSPSPPARRSPTESTDPAELPPVQITIGEDGRLVITSQDPRALDLMEDLIAQLAKPRKNYQLFALKYASAYWVRLNLEDFFEEKEEDTGSRRRNYFFYDYPPPQEKEKRYRLSQRRPLKFIDDMDTNSVLVVNADAEQLGVIADLVKLWDTPPPSDSQSARISSVFQIRYSKASIIAEAIKEVYRDLLSANDKSFQQGQPQDKRPTNQTTYIFGDGGEDEPDRRTQVAFKGKLSLGVDEVANILLVSTEGQTLMDNVGKMIEALDEAARPAADMRVLTLQGNINSSHVRQVLAEIMGKSLPIEGQPGGQTPKPPTGGPPGAGGPPAAQAGG